VKNKDFSHNESQGVAQDFCRKEPVSVAARSATGSSARADRLSRSQKGTFSRTTRKRSASKTRPAKAGRDRSDLIVWKRRYLARRNTSSSPAGRATAKQSSAMVALVGVLRRFMMFLSGVAQQHRNRREGRCATLEGRAPLLLRDSYICEQAEWFSFKYHHERGSTSQDRGGALAG